MRLVENNGARLRIHRRAHLVIGNQRALAR
jgi:hypothetical protein